MTLLIVFFRRYGCRTRSFARGRFCQGAGNGFLVQPDDMVKLFYAAVFYKFIRQSQPRYGRT